jgi:hypothetical protein
MLSEEELTYTQMLNKLDIDTGHLNYYLEGLGELVAKTSEGKYRLSEFGRAAVRLMAGVEEAEPALNEKEKNRFSKRRIARLSQAICIIALILSGVFLMTISDVEIYTYSKSGSLDSKDLRVIAPDAMISSIDNVNARQFPTDTLTTHYRTFYQVEIVGVNVSLRMQVSERIWPAASFPPEASEDYYQEPTLIHNQTHEGPYGSVDENGIYAFSRLNYKVQIPVESPQQKGMLVSNSFVEIHP